jgi:endo-1,4-beta-xylanase
VTGYRRSLSALVLLACASTPRAPRVEASEIPSLARLARARGKHFGTAVRVDALRSDARYVGMIKEQFDTLVLESEMKMRHIQPRRGVFEFGDADYAVLFARESGMKMRGHTLVWAESIPDWVTNGAFTSAELAEIMHRHIQTEVSHFRALAPGTVYAWDVVNEAFDDRDDGTIRDDLPFKKIGNGKDDVIRFAFEWAREADPDAKLFYSDYKIETMNGRSDAAYAMIRSMKAEGVPIDGVSFHMHQRSDAPRSPDDVAKNMARFAALGLEIQITEFDDRLPVSVVRSSRGASSRLRGDGARLRRRAGVLALHDVGLHRQVLVDFRKRSRSRLRALLRREVPAEAAFFGLVRALSRTR